MARKIFLAHHRKFDKPIATVCRLSERIGGVLNHHWFLSGYGLIILSSLLIMPELTNSPQGDLRLYHEVTKDLLQGKLPYRDRVLEYPPYVIPVLSLPIVFGIQNYPDAFKLTVFVVDLIVKFYLLAAGMHHSKTARRLLPLLCYCVAIPFVGHFYLQRYDVWPTLQCLIVIWLFWSKRYFLAGLTLAGGIGLKVYPAVFVPTLFMLAARRGKLSRFLAGMTAGLAPIVVISFYLPWWRFAQFQGTRGLQVESFYSSALWMLEQIGVLHVQWVHYKAWYELQGSWASAILPWARGCFLMVVISSMIITTLAARKSEILSIAQLARILLVPLLAFVCFNVVFSPQFMIWLLPLAALASLESNPLPLLAVPFATILTPLFFPSLEYDNGLDLFQTVILLTRNVTLIALWAYLTLELIGIDARGSGLSYTSSWRQKLRLAN